MPVVCRWRCTPTRCNCSGLANDALDMDKHDPKKFQGHPQALFVQQG